MIYDTLNHIGQYRGISPQLDLALTVLRETDFSTLAAGRYDVNEDVYYNVMLPTTRSFEETKWECHRAYLDIQYVLTSDEQIAWSSLDAVRDWSEYSTQGDSCTSVQDAPYVVLPMGEDRFAVFFPGDAHRPCWAVGAPKQVKKVVIKVRI